MWQFGYFHICLGVIISGKPGRPPSRLLSYAVGAWPPLLYAPCIMAGPSLAEGENSLRA